MRLYALAIVLFSLTLLDLTASQVPPRLSIPGALLVSSGPQRSSSSSASSRSRPSPSYLQDFPAPARRAKPSPNAIPVVEDVDDLPQQQPSLSSSSSASSASSGSAAFDEEVARLGIGTLQAAAAVAAREEFQQQQQQQQPKFRPERPVPVLRQDVRESAAPQPQRQVFRESIGAARARQEARDEEENVPVVVRRPQPIRAAIPQDYRPSIRAQPAPQQSTRQQIRYDPDDDPKRSKNRKPPVQILRKYRTDNDDGSITWGYENEDGTFKEETIGVDCIVRGKYGYTDPDGVRREYTYEAGGVCDPDPEEELAQDPRAQDPRAQAPLPKGGKKIYRLPV